MKFKSFVRTAATTFTLTLACALPAQAAGTWETTLLGRDINLNAVAATDVSTVYGLTALTAWDIAKRTLDGQAQPGFQTPSQVFGADYILAFAGSKRMDL